MFPLLTTMNSTRGVDITLGSKLGLHVNSSTWKIRSCTAKRSNKWITSLEVERWACGEHGVALLEREEHEQGRTMKTTLDAGETGTGFSFGTFRDLCQ